MADSKLLLDIAERLGFKTEDKRNRAYGIYNGIPFVIDSSGVYVTAEATSIGEAQKEEIKKFIKKNRKKYSVDYLVKFTKHSVRVRLWEAFETGNSETVIGYLEDISKFFELHGLKGGCFICGTEGVFPFGKKDEDILTVCIPCFSQYQKDLEALKEERANKVPASWVHCWDLRQGSCSCL